MIHLFEKVLLNNAKEDFTTYKLYLLSLPSDEILNHAYEYAVKLDILMALGSLLHRQVLNEQQIKALSQLPCPLEELYKDTNKHELITSTQLKEMINRKVKSLDTTRIE